MAKKKKQKVDRSKRVTKKGERQYPGRPLKEGNHADADYYAANFSKNLTRLRKERDLTQSEMAKILGVHRITVNRLEKGKHQPFLGDAKRFARALGSSLDEMCADHDRR